MEVKKDSKVVLETPVFNVEMAHVVLPNGKVEERWFVVKSGVSFIIPIDAQGNILLVKEWRSAIENYAWRIPAGKRDKNEDFLATAKRELREDTGFDAKNYEEVERIKPASAWLKNENVFFVARDLFVSPLNTGDEYEQLKLYPTSPPKVLEMIYNGDIQGDIALALMRYIKKIVGI